MGAVGGGEPGQPAGSPTSGTSALEKNNSGILFNRQTGSSKICTEPMGRWMACNSALRQYERRSGSVDRPAAMPPLSHCSVVQCVEQFSLASAPPIERKGNRKRKRHRNQN